MSKEERSLFDEIWDAAGLSKEEAPADPPQEIKQPEIAKEIAPAEKATEEIVEPSTNEAVEAPAEEVPEATAEEVPEEPAEEVPPEEAKEEEPKEAPAEEPKEEAPGANEHTVKKKSVKFLVIYTIAFVLVVAALISGSYMISSRLQQEMAEGNEAGASQSKLENIQDKNAALKKENAAIKEQNDLLSASQADADELIAGAGDMVEHNEYLAAAMDEYIRGNRTTARTILSTIDREKLSPTFQEYYDSLDDRLN